MNTQILFTGPGRAELVDIPLPDRLLENEVMVQMAYTAVSAGTERDNLAGAVQVSSRTVLKEAVFPRALGYSGSGIVTAVGSAVQDLATGDRVLVYFGQHKKFNIVPSANIFKIKQDQVCLKEVALVIIAAFSLAGVRKARLEIGEAALVAGLGILGQFAVQLLRLGGAVPVIAADPQPERVSLALDLGADYGLDPLRPDYQDRIMELTGGKGVDLALEVSGSGVALAQAAAAAADFGRVVLLGCTRDPVAEFDFYHLVHGRGTSLIGANNFARPVLESRPGNWTAEDDCQALLALLAGGRLSFARLVNKICQPQEAPAVYKKLLDDPGGFPLGLLFEWNIES